REVDHVARRVLDRAELDPLGTRRRRALHEERLALRAVGIAAEHHRAIADVRQEDGGDLGVVPQQVALVGPAAREEDLAEVREGDLAVADPDGRGVDVARDAIGDRARERGARAAPGMAWGAARARRAGGAR